MGYGENSYKGVPDLRVLINNYNKMWRIIRSLQNGGGGGGLTSSQEYGLRVTLNGGVVENIEAVQTELDAVTNEKLVLIPSGYGNGIIYSQIPNNGLGDGTFIRASTSTRINKQGVIETVAINIPRINYLSSNAILLLEPQSTNYFTFSNDFSNAYWVKGGTTIKTDGTLNIEGLVAQKLVEDVSLGEHYIVANTSITGADRLVSIFVKAAGRTKIQIALSYSTASYDCAFDLITKTFSAIGTLITTYGYDDNYKDGWIRVWIGSQDASANILRLRLNNGVAINYQGDGVSGVYIGQPQIEAYNAPTSYIKTSGSTVTRLADSASIAVPSGVTQIIETIDGVEQSPITTIPTTYNLPYGNINKIKMI